MLERRYSYNYNLYQKNINTLATNASKLKYPPLSFGSSFNSFDYKNPEVITDLDEVVKQNKKTCFMIGTYNPFHITHFQLGENAITQYGFDRVIFIPLHNPPHKSLLEQLTTAEKVQFSCSKIKKYAEWKPHLYDKNKNCKLMVCDPSILGNDGASPTKIIKLLAPDLYKSGKEINVIMGSDTLKIVPDDAAELLEKCKIHQVIVDPVPFVKEIAVGGKKIKLNTVELKQAELEISSTEIRDAFKGKTGMPYISEAFTEKKPKNVMSNPSLISMHVKSYYNPDILHLFLDRKKNKNKNIFFKNGATFDTKMREKLKILYVYSSTPIFHSGTAPISTLKPLSNDSITKDEIKKINASYIGKIDLYNDRQAIENCHLFYDEGKNGDYELHIRKNFIKFYSLKGNRNSTMATYDYPENFRKNQGYFDMINEKVRGYVKNFLSVEGHQYNSDNIAYETAFNQDFPEKVKLFKYGGNNDRDLFKRITHYFVLLLYKGKK